MNEEFKLRLKAGMISKGMNPASLSIAAGLNRRAVADLLEGQATSPKLSTAFALAKALESSLDELTGQRPQVSIAPKMLELLSQYGRDEQEQLAAAIANLPPAPATRR